ncbi:MAG TPA: PhzF family phenazine biosynthesis protein [Mycobacteriales bacterium]
MTIWPRSGGPRPLAYHVVDVFTERAYAGNPLAVVLDGDDLSTQQCQAIAREFNLSETTFPMATSTRADYRLRIFTPGAELPFAGHPSVGTAWLMRSLGRVAGPRVVQDCLAGLLPLWLRTDGTVELTGGTPSVGPPVPAGDLLRAVGLDDGDAMPARSARRAGTGSDFTYVCVRDEAVGRARPGADLTAALTPTGGHGLFLFSWNAGAVHARMFAPGLGVGEDPATGSAATGLGAWLAAEDLVDDGETAYVVEQGGEIGRPSTMYGTVVVERGVAVECRVAGTVVAVASGTISVPDLP